MEISELEAISRRLRRRILDVCMASGGGHLGGAFSVIDILVALYFNHLKPGDKVVFSKGHACLALYAVLEEAGVLPAGALAGYCKDGGTLHGHPKRGTPGVEVTAGSLGHGLSIAAGMAYANRDRHVFCILGDGEMNEGSVWEAMMFAAQHKLTNLTAIVDNNGLESLDRTDNIMSIEPIGTRAQDFGWTSIWIGPGMDTIRSGLIRTTLYEAKLPHMFVVKSVKGRGVSFMENSTKWHYRCPTAEEYAAAMRELS